MAPIRPTTVANIFEYTVVAANALHGVAVAAQMPFISTVCTLVLAIIPMVQVWTVDGNLHCGTEH
jgi:hypothetical protein